MLRKCENCIHLKIEYFESYGGYFAYICEVSLLDPHEVVCCALYESKQIKIEDLEDNDNE